MPRDSLESVNTPADRRQRRRHKLQRPCRVAPAAAPLGEITGVTTDISRSGMLVRLPGVAILDLLPKVGESARIVIDLPPSANYAPRSLECVARVVRVASPDRDNPALAFEIERMKIRSRPEQSSPGTPHPGGCIQ
jgi:hypothetical protein